jgi:hypothetical protein
MCKQYLPNNKIQRTGTEILDQWIELVPAADLVVGRLKA